MQNEKMDYGFGECCFKRFNEDSSWEHGIFLRSVEGDFAISEKGECFKAEEVVFKQNETASNFERLCSLSLCSFCRQENGPWERGVLINEGRIGIMDKYGMIVLNCWDWRAVNGFYIDIIDFLNPFPIE